MFVPKTTTSTTSTTTTAKAATTSHPARVEDLDGSDEIDVLPSLSSRTPAMSSDPHTASSAIAPSPQSAQAELRISARPPLVSPPSDVPHGRISHSESAAEHEVFREYVPPVDEVVMDTGTNRNTGTSKTVTTVTFTTRRRRNSQHGQRQVVVSPMKRGMKRSSMNVDATLADGLNPDLTRPDLAPEEDRGFGCSHFDGDDRYHGPGHGRLPQGDARPLKKSRTCTERSSALSEGEGEQGRGPTLSIEAEVKGPIPASTSTSTTTSAPTRTTVLPARTKYTPSPLPVLPSPSIPRADRSGVLPHLTHLREAHRKIGIGCERERCRADGLVPAAVGSEGRAELSASGSGSRPRRRKRGFGCMSRAPAREKDLVKSHAHSSLMVRTNPGENGSSQGPPEAPLHNASMANAAPASVPAHPLPLPPPSMLCLTKPVAFTFRVDARLDARKADAHKLLSMSEPQPSTQAHHETRPAPLYDSHHGETWLRLRKENATTAAIPFVFCTEQRAKERAKFDAMMHQKEEEMARVREEARRRAEEEEEREIREIRRRAVPKANEVPEWYMGMPKRKRGECKGEQKGNKV